MIPIHQKSYNQWKRHVYIICRSERSKLVPELSIGEVKALIERGNQPKKEGKYSNYDEWAHSMRMLEKKLKEIRITTDAR